MHQTGGGGGHVGGAPVSASPTTAVLNALHGDKAGKKNAGAMNGHAQAEALTNSHASGTSHPVAKAKEFAIRAEEHIPFTKAHEAKKNAEHQGVARTH